MRLSLQGIASRRNLLHLAFWLIMLMLVFTKENMEYNSQFQWHIFIQFLIAFFLFAVVSYFNLYVLVPRIFKARKYVMYVIALVVSILVGSSLTIVVKLVLKVSGFAHQLDHGHLDHFVHMIYGQIMFILATSFFYILEEWIRLQSVTITMGEIESRRIQSELQALKGQINPHFLFNTLNNLYSHSLEQSPQTPEMILKLSALMSYILYDCRDERVPVDNELEFIRNYIELEKLRFEDQVEISLDIDEQKGGRMIVPLLLIPFVDNAFKHGGTSGKRKKTISLSISIDEKLIHFNITNSVFGEYISKHATRESGIGIQNVKKRLELLYPGCHELTINKTEDQYSVDLKLFDHGH